MKKLLLFVLVFGVGFSSMAQTKHVLRSNKAPKADVLMEKAPSSAATILVNDKPTVKTGQIKGVDASYIPIGQSGNAYGFYNNPRTYVWADPNLNSIVFTHRMTGGVEVEGNSRVAYDVSTDGGASWTTNVQAYLPTGPGPQYPQDGGRYPQGAIINPEGNMNPADAYYSYFLCTLDNTNGNWGGYAYGSNPLTLTDPPAPSQVNLHSGGNFWRLIPDAYTVTQQGVAWYTDGNYETADYVYNGVITIGRGEIVDGELEVVETQMDFLADGDGINDSKIAFGPDGQTGYIVYMSDVVSDPTPYTSYHPVLLKTTDGGESWSDPINVQFGGVNGIESIKYYWSDEILESIDIYGPGFNRDEVYYNMGFQCDIAVDGQGNPHLNGLITIASPDGWYPGEGTMAEWHLYSTDGGTTWNATALYDNIFFDGDIGAIVQYNRPYVGSTLDGHYLFFSWLDTDLEGAEGNTNPNIFVVGYDTEDMVYTDVDNVTELSLYWFSAFYGSMSQYVFAEKGDDEWTCEIPFVFTEYTVPGDDTQEMNFYYIDGYTISMAVGIGDNEELANFSVAQNSPNPAVNNTSILVTTETPGAINLRVSNILGQVVHNQSVSNSALAYTFNVDVSNLDSGIYFYTIEIGNKSVTKKMLVK